MKPGFTTTEFWLVVIVGVLTNLGTIEVPDRYKWVVNLLLVVGYAVSRGLAKYENRYGDQPAILVPEAVDPVAVEQADQKAAVAKAKRALRK